ncbi:ATP-dependent RNA helicase dbp6 [Rhizophlyctis rosea]|nr:ATP-dependent RNA helicase dbp6 [Rhizophlyctis rosea]
MSARAPLPSQEEARVAAIEQKQEDFRLAAKELRKQKRSQPKADVPAPPPAEPELNTQYPEWRGTKRTFDDVNDEAEVGGAEGADGEGGKGGGTNGVGDGANGRPKKKKRGGKKQKEKEMKWKLKNGMTPSSKVALDSPGMDVDQDETEVGENGGVTEKELKEDDKKADDVEKPGADSDVDMDGADSDEQSDAQDNDEPTTAETHELNPKLPPTTTTDARRPTQPSKHAGLPDWLAHPLTISPYRTYSPDYDITNTAFNLSPKVLSRLTSQNITHLFPVQAAVLPRLLRTRHSSAPVPPSDLCVSAPTGSGKTLAYALPIVEGLSARIIPRLRALVILPTRDLASQVKSVFDSLVKGTDIKVALVTGQTAFAAEQAMLVSREKGDVWTEGDGGSSKVDVLVATPGRLIDHLKETRGFTLRHLRFLVIDEADRLLNQSYHDWLQHILKAAAGDKVVVDPFDDVPDVDSSVAEHQSSSLPSSWTRLTHPTTPLGLPLHTATTHRYATKSPTLPPFGHLSHYTPLQKLLFSATLTRNPSKIASLHLHHPVYIAVAGGEGEEGGDETARYVAPSTLTEHMVVTPTSGEKPLALIWLLTSGGVGVKDDTSILVFTKSVESAHRLAVLLRLYDETLNPHALTSDLTPRERKRILTQFTSGKIKLLITSDILSRGIDPGAHVGVVINYDVPPDTKTYVHRVGRTARAGRTGQAWTVCGKSEVRFFKGVWRKVGRGEGRGVKEVKWEVGEGVEERGGEGGEGMGEGKGKAKKVEESSSDSSSSSSSDDSSSDGDSNDSDSESESEDGKAAKKGGEGDSDSDDSSEDESVDGKEGEEDNDDSSSGSDDSDSDEDEGGSSSSSENEDEEPNGAATTRAAMEVDSAERNDPLEQLLHRAASRVAMVGRKLK